MISHPHPPPLWEGKEKSGICMSVRIKIFLLLSAVLLCSIMLYVWIYAGIDHQRLMDELEFSSGRVKTAFKAEQDSTEMRMLQISTFATHDSKVQQLFLLGKKAVELEGGAGGELSAQVRKSLYKHLQEAQKSLSDQFGFRQLHFHFGSGSLSFLRVHRPQEFGDRMDAIRHTIVATNAEQKNTMGFETGRVLSGLRGVAPVYAFDAAIKEQVYVGALEAGTSFDNMLSLFHTSRPWLNAAVLLSQRHMKANLWPDFLKMLLAEGRFTKGFYVEATTSPEIKKFLIRDDFSEILSLPGHYLRRDGNFHLSFSSFPLRDFRGETNPSIPDAGLVVVWRDVSQQFSAYHSRISSLIFYGVLLFLVIESLMYLALNLVTSQLQKELLKTQKQEAETEQARLVAEESSRLKTEFLSNMSHELRTPMNAIIGLGQLLSDSRLDDRQQDYIKKINLSSKHLLILINEVLLVAEVDAQTAEELVHENYSPAQLVSWMLEKFATKAKDQGVNLKVDIAADLPDKIDGYSAQMEQILEQLLGNAIKFSHDGDVILSLRLVAQDGDSVILEYAVSDQGIGISAEQQQQIFASFYQGDGSKTRDYGGTGLGLTIAQKICHQLGGDITVKSTPGQGSLFSFQLKYKILSEGFVRSDVATNNTVLAVAEEENVTVQVMGTFSVLGKLLQRLEEPLTKMQPQPCQNIATELKAKQWSENLSADIEALTGLIGKYRFVEAWEVVVHLRQLISQSET